MKRHAGLVFIAGLLIVGMASAIENYVQTRLPGPSAGKWKRFESNSLVFQYPSDWDVRNKATYGSRSEVEFVLVNPPKDLPVRVSKTFFYITFSANYNNATGKEFASLDEFMENGAHEPSQFAKDITIGGYRAKRISRPRDAKLPYIPINPYEKVVFQHPGLQGFISLNFTSPYPDIDLDIAVKKWFDPLLLTLRVKL